MTLQPSSAKAATAASGWANGSAGQCARVLPKNWGLSLKKHDANDASCQDVALWEDGTVAAGAQKLGKGRVIDFGMFESVALITQCLTRWGSNMCPATSRTRRSSYATSSNNGLYENGRCGTRRSRRLRRSGLRHGRAARVGYRQTPAKRADFIWEDECKIRLPCFWILAERALLMPRNQLRDAPHRMVLAPNAVGGAAPPTRASRLQITQRKLWFDLTDDNALKILPGDGGANPPEAPGSLSVSKNRRHFLAQKLARHVRYSQTYRRPPRRLP